MKLDRIRLCSLQSNLEVAVDLWVHQSSNDQKSRHFGLTILGHVSHEVLISPKHPNWTFTIEKIASCDSSEEANLLRIVQIDTKLELVSAECKGEFCTSSEARNFYELNIGEVLETEDQALSGTLVSIGEPVDLYGWDKEHIGELSRSLTIELEQKSLRSKLRPGSLFSDLMGRPVGLLIGLKDQRAFLIPLFQFLKDNNLHISSIESNSLNLGGFKPDDFFKASKGQLSYIENFQKITMPLIEELEDLELEGA